MQKFRAWWLLLFIIVIGATLRSVHIETRSLWFDEAFTWRLIQFPVVEMVTRDIADVHPPLYYLLLKGWAGIFGSSVVALRSFSIMAAAGTMAAVYGLANYAFSSRPVGLLAALLVAITGFQIQVAEEARMYTLGTLLAVLSAWLLLRVLREEKPVWLHVGAYGVVLAAFAYIHYYAFFSIAAQVLFIGLYLGVATHGRVGEILHWRLTWRLAASGVVAALLYAPWVPYFLEQRSRVQQSFWIPLIDKWSIPDTAYRMFIPTFNLPRWHGGFFVLLSLLPLLLLLAVWVGLGVRTLWQRGTVRPAVWLVLLCGVVPVVLAAIISRVSQSVYQDRYFVFAHVFLLIAISYVLVLVRPRALRYGVMAVVVVGILVAQGSYWRHLNISQKPGVRGATAAIFAEQKKVEAIVTNSPFIFFSLVHYAEEQNGAGSLVKLYTEGESVAHFAGGPILTPADVVHKDIFTTTTASTVWVVNTTGFGGQALVVPSPWRAGTKKSFPEVFGYQGEVVVTAYQR